MNLCSALTATTCLVIMGFAAAQTTTVVEEFRRLPADTLMSTGQSVANDCQDPAADHPYHPYDWPEASATLELQQDNGGSSVTIDVKAARPDTYYTVWVRLSGKDESGAAFGGSPLTGAPGTPLVPTSEFEDVLAATGPENGNDHNSNGFYTDANGDATFTIDLDFPIVNGAYPFHKVTGFDAADERYPLDDPRIIPVAIVGPGAPFTLRIASHCTDGVGHGLVPGPHEGWFDWSFGP